MPLDHTQVKNLLINAGCNTRDAVEYVRENMHATRDLLDARQKLRDKFAIAAITGTLPGSALNVDEYAALAYRMADAMMRAREPKL
jgi:hypothetical protein